MKEVLLAGVMTVGMGGAVEAQQESPPLVEQAMDLKPMMEGLDIYVDFSQEPQFFQEMQRKANGPDADKYFSIKPLVGRKGNEYRYNDEGLTENEELNKVLTDVYLKHEVTVQVDKASQLDLWATADTINLVMGEENTIASDRRVGSITADAVIFDYFDNVPDEAERKPVTAGQTGNVLYTSRDGRVDNDTWFLLAANDGQVIYQYTDFEFVDKDGEPFADDLQDELFTQREEFYKGGEE